MKISCEFCGHQFDTERHEHCPKCEGGYQHNQEYLTKKNRNYNTVADSTKEKPEKSFQNILTYDLDNLKDKINETKERVSLTLFNDPKALRKLGVLLFTIIACIIFITVDLPGYVNQSEDIKNGQYETGVELPDEENVPSKPLEPSIPENLNNTGLHAWVNNQTYKLCMTDYQVSEVMKPSGSPDMIILQIGYSLTNISPYRVSVSNKDIECYVNGEKMSVVYGQLSSINTKETLKGLYGFIVPKDFQTLVFKFDNLTITINKDQLPQP